ncbi:hypothetical protein [Novosphingobium sp. M1R2S20]|uniref:Beta-propeller repeat-containing protein n=1 Tax=Novosphingobium rhizovicinum TaxID=3228928 RepID=A0ABV3R8V7_9SPHN
MSINLSNSLAGLSLLSGSNAFSTLGYGADLGIETRAARIAKAQFKTPVTSPPWKQEASPTPVSSQVAAIKRLRSLVDQPSRAGTTIPDVQTTFTAYKALDRLRMLAETAASKTTSTLERNALDATFSKGLTDLQTFLGKAPNDLLQLAFGQPARRVEGIAVPSTAASTTVAKGILEARDTPVPGLTGTETFTIQLSRGTMNNTVTVDLAGTPQPPTLDSVAEALNAAIAAVPMRDTQGNVVTNADGNPVPRWSTQFEVTKETGSWGLKLQTPAYERVSIEQTNARDALVVASGQTATGSPSATKIMRFDDPAGALEISTLNMIQSLDRLATEAAKLNETEKDPAENVWAPTTTSAIATDAQGYSYVVGTTEGDLGANRLGSTSDLFLTKLDSEGKVVWQQTLGTAATAKGAAVTVAANGDIVVAGTVTGDFKGATTDGDMVVARFSANGDEQFATVVRAFGADTANAVAVGNDGNIYVAGKSASGGGDAFIARLNGTGQVQERRTIDSGGSDAVKALAIGADGDLLALTSEGGTAMLRKISAGSLTAEAGTIDLGARDARVIAVAADGQIAIGGTSAGDGFVARIDSALTGASFTQIATPGIDQVDSLSFMDGALYVGGRTTGDLEGTRSGTVDGFIARIDAATGTVDNITQFGQPTLRTDPVYVAASKGGDSALGALGLNRGNINPDVSVKLTTHTSVRAGDEFQIRVNDGTVRRIVIDADETLATLSKKVSTLTGRNALVTTPLDGKGNRTLRIEAKPGQEIELIAGASGKDALAKLGIEPVRISAAAPVPDDAPRVRPGGNYGLGLTHALGLTTVENAAAALDRITSAISMTQTAYRSLYWDAGKEAIVNNSGRKGGKVSAYQAAQAARYQAALDRLSGSTF